mgnify:CR=1 FL=1
MNDKKLFLGKKSWLQILFFVVAIVLVVYFAPRSSHREFSYEIGKPWTGVRLYAKASMAVPLDPATEKAKKDSINKAFVPYFRHDVTVAEEALGKLNQTVGGSFLVSQLKTIYDAGIVDNEVYDSIVEKNCPSSGWLRLERKGKWPGRFPQPGCIRQKLPMKNSKRLSAGLCCHRCWT